MTYEITSKTVGAYRVAVVYDNDPMNPRKEWDNVGTVVLIDRCRYDFGDEHASYDELREIANNPANICLPIYMYDHSGITINTTGFSCAWDSGQVGIIYCTKEQAIKEWGKKILTKKARDAAVKCMQAEIETLDQYLTGQVYGYIVYDAEGDDVDSCWGFFGEEEYCLGEGVASAEYFVEKDMERRREAWRKALREARERRYWANRGVETTV